MRPSKRFWKVLLGGALFLIVGFAGFGTWVVSLRDQKWAALEARVDELFKELDAPPLERLPLGRSLLPGNAWDDYLAAAAGPSGNLPWVINGKMVPWLRRDADASTTEVRSLILGFAPQIDLVRKGTRREQAKLPAPTYGTNGIEYPFRNYYSYPDLGSLLVGKARLRAEEGDLSEALQILVDVCVYGRDLAGSRQPGGASSGLAVMNIAFREMRDILQRRPLGPEDLAFLDRALELLDERFPDTAGDLRGDLLELGILLRREDREDTPSHGLRSQTRWSWQSCFSTRFQAEATYGEAESIVHRALALESKPWVVAGPGNLELEAEKRRFRDFRLQYHLGHLTVAPSAIGTRGNLRLLRVATHFRACGKVIGLGDPVGGLIRTRTSEKSLLIWRKSLFGAPDWEPKENNPSYNYELSTEVDRPR